MPGEEGVVVVVVGVVRLEVDGEEMRLEVEMVGVEGEGETALGPWWSA